MKFKEKVPGVSRDILGKYQNSPEIKTTKRDLYYDTVKHLEDFEKKHKDDPEKLSLVTLFKSKLEKLKKGLLDID